MDMHNLKIQLSYLKGNSWNCQQLTALDELRTKNSSDGSKIVCLPVPTPQVVQHSLFCGSIHFEQLLLMCFLLISI